MKFIGLLMVADEDDILERTLGHNAQLVDCFYAICGDDASLETVKRHPKCFSATSDVYLRLMQGYPEKPVDGYRAFILERAYSDHGYNNWFVLLHGDELWTHSPRAIADEVHDGFIFQLPFYFPRDGEPWDDEQHPIDQLAWHLAPGYPEFRMFRGGPKVHYHREQHFNVRPSGLRNVGACTDPIYHYPYRSPEVQRARAARHELTQFDPDNYRHITDRDAVYWTDEMIDLYRAKPWFSELRCNGVPVL